MKTIKEKQLSPEQLEFAMVIYVGMNLSEELFRKESIYDEDDTAAIFDILEELSSLILWLKSKHGISENTILIKANLLMHSWLRDEYDMSPSHIFFNNIEELIEWLYMCEDYETIAEYERALMYQKWYGESS